MKNLKGSKSNKHYRMVMLEQSRHNNCVMYETIAKMYDHKLKVDKQDNIVLYTFMLDLSTCIQVLCFHLDNGQAAATFSILYGNRRYSKFSTSELGTGDAAMKAMRTFVCSILDDSLLWTKIEEAVLSKSYTDTYKFAVKVLLQKFSGVRSKPMIELPNRLSNINFII